MILSSWHLKPLNAPFVPLHPFHKAENQVMCQAQRTRGGDVLKWQLFQQLDKNVHHDQPTRRTLEYLHHCNSFVLFRKLNCTHLLHVYLHFFFQLTKIPVDNVSLLICPRIEFLLPVWQIWLFCTNPCLAQLCLEADTVLWASSVLLMGSVPPTH